MSDRVSVLIVVLVTTVSCGKTAEPIDTPIWGQARVA